MKKYFLLVFIMIGCLLLVGCGGGDETGGHTDDHEHGDLPYEWSGEYPLEAGTYTLDFQQSGDPSCNIAFIINEGDMDDLAHHAHHVMEADMETVEAGGHFTAWPDYAYKLTLNPDQTLITFDLEEAGDYVIFLEHFPHEFDLKFIDGSGRELTAANPQEYEDEGHYH